MKIFIKILTVFVLIAALSAVLFSCVSLETTTTAGTTKAGDTTTVAGNTTTTTASLTTGSNAQLSVGDSDPDGNQWGVLHLIG